MYISRICCYRAESMGLHSLANVIADSLSHTHSDLATMIAQLDKRIWSVVDDEIFPYFFIYLKFIRIDFHFTMAGM